jgi:hypothetical protein
MASLAISSFTGAPLSDAMIAAIATAVTSAATQSPTGQANHAITEITHRIQDRFRDRPADLAILTAAQGESASADQAAELAHALDRVVAEDPAFGEEIRTIWDRSGIAAITATGETVVNIVSGKADKVVQLRDLHGDLTIN